MSQFFASGGQSVGDSGLIKDPHQWTELMIGEIIMGGLGLIVYPFKEPILGFVDLFFNIF